MGISDRPAHGENNVVEFTTSQIKPIKQLFEGIKNKLPDTGLLFDATRMKIMQIDTARTFLVDVKLEGENFEHYYCDPSRCGNDHIEIGLNAETINSVFKSLTKDDTILTFSYKYQDNHVNITFHNSKKAETKSFDIAIQVADPNDEFKEISAEDLESYEYFMSMPTADLSGICKALKNIDCEIVRIKHDGSTLTFKSEGVTPTRIIREGTIGTSQGAQDSEKLVFTRLPDDGSGPYSGQFKFSTFHEFTKSQGNGDNKIVQIMLKKNAAIILHYKIGDLGEMYIAMASVHEEEGEGEGEF